MSQALVSLAISRDICLKHVPRYQGYQ